MTTELVAFSRHPSASTPFNEGYIAAARRLKAFRPITCPYPKGTLAAQVWDEGKREWELDKAAGLIPPPWRM